MCPGPAGTCHHGVMVPTDEPDTAAADCTPCRLSVQDESELLHGDGYNEGAAGGEEEEVLEVVQGGRGQAGQGAAAGTDSSAAAPERQILESKVGMQAAAGTGSTCWCLAVTSVSMLPSPQKGLKPRGLMPVLHASTMMVHC